MNKIHKILLILSIFLLIAGCSQNKEIVLPNSEDIEKIEITNNKDNRKLEIFDEEKVDELIKSLINKGKYVNKESVNDQPTNIDEYHIISFYYKEKKENPSIIYLYKNGGKYYMEQPYQGIWKIDEEIYEKINS